MVDKPYQIIGSEQIDGKTYSQFFDVLKQDFIVSGALMPDAHVGYALPIGGVAVADSCIVPAYVGYDIGCSVSSHLLPKEFVTVEDIVANQDAIFDEIYKVVPVGHNHHASGQKGPVGLFDNTNVSDVLKKEIDSGSPARQLGTLGGGNHFIEIGEDLATGQVAISVHSGSRNVGRRIGEHYMRLAAGTGKASEGHFPLYQGTPEFEDYQKDLWWCCDFVLWSHSHMIRAVHKVIQQVVGCKHDLGRDYPTYFSRHNFAELMLAGEQTYYIHRKGATQLENGLPGLIPGSMKDGIYVVQGKGSGRDNLWSCSHGAGRVFGRREAKENLNFEDFRLQMDGIKAKVTSGTIDESPAAYKNIHHVMSAQASFVQPISIIRPLINIKA